MKRGKSTPLPTEGPQRSADMVSSDSGHQEAQPTMERAHLETEPLPVAEAASGVAPNHRKHPRPSRPLPPTPGGSESRGRPLQRCSKHRRCRRICSSSSSSSRESRSRTPQHRTSCHSQDAEECQGPPCHRCSRCDCSAAGRGHRGHGHCSQRSPISNASALIPGPHSAGVTSQPQNADAVTSQATVPAATSIHPSSPQRRAAHHPLQSISSDEDSSSSSSSDSSRAASPSPFVTRPPPLLPIYNVRSYKDQILRLTKALGLQIQQPTIIDDPIFKDIQEPPQAILPFLPYLLHVVKTSWSNPSSVPPISRKLDNLYKIDDSSLGWLGQHPKQNSMIVGTVHSEFSGEVHSTPFDEEGKKIDSMGRKIYSSASLLLKISNYSASMGAYQKFLWDKVAPFFEKLPEEDRRACSVIQQEACTLSRHQLQVSEHIAHCAGKVMANSISLCRHAWLRTLNLPPFARATVEEMPFDGTGLFHAETDSRILYIDKMQAVVKKLCRPSSLPPSDSRSQRRWRMAPYRTQSSHPSARSRPRPQF